MKLTRPKAGKRDSRPEIEIRIKKENGGIKYG